MGQEQAPSAMLKVYPYRSKDMDMDYFVQTHQKGFVFFKPIHLGNGVIEIDL
jgi:hypothetical protein